MSILDLLRINKDKRLVDEPPMSEEEFIRQTQPKIFNVIDKFYKDYTRPIGDSNLGIMNLVQAGRFFSNPTFTSGLFSPIGTLAIGGLRSLFSNIKDPYKSAFGNLNRQTREAINRDRIRDLQQSFQILAQLDRIQEPWLIHSLVEHLFICHLKYY